MHRGNVLNKCSKLTDFSQMFFRCKKFSTHRKNVDTKQLKMLAWQIHSYGDLEELRLSNTARVPYLTNPNDILVKVTASSVNPIDLLMMRGYGSVLLNKVRQIEACSFSETLEFPLTLGRDFSGEVVAKGLEVRNALKIGDKVWGTLPLHYQGSHAQFVEVNKLLVHRAPSNLSVTEAGSIPYAAVTAWSALKITGDLYWQPTRGKRVLVLGGSGGVGTTAIQLLKAWGCYVVTTCQGDAAPLLESLGADSIINYTEPDAQTQIREEGKYDIILDAAGLGADAGLNYMDCLKDWNLSKYVTLRSPMLLNTDEYGFILGMTKNVASLLLSNVQANLASQSSTIRWGFYMPVPDAIKEITSLVEEEKICPVIEKIYSFSELPAAYEKVKAGHLRGKIVINMNESECDV